MPSWEDGKTLYEHTVWSRSRHKHWVSALDLDYIFIGAFHRCGGTEGGFLWLTIDPEGEATHHAFRWQENLATCFVCVCTPVRK